MLRITADLQGEEKELTAGLKKWVRNDLYPDDFRKEYHCLSFAYSDEKLVIADSMINTSYREVYTLDFHGKMRGAWQPNVTYLDNNDCSPREFDINIEK